VDGSNSGVIERIVSDPIDGRGQGDTTAAQQVHRLARQRLGVGGLGILDPDADGPFEEITYKNNTLVYGISALSVTW
jgi:hypothetical protein